MRKKWEKLPVWLHMVIGLVLVVALGVVDYVTGDYSILIFYAVPVTIVAWCVGRWGSVVISVAAGISRFISDYLVYQGPNFKYWNSLQDMIFLLMLGLIIATMKDLVEDEGKERQ